jgi:hypothetical protein
MMMARYRPLFAAGLLMALFGCVKPEPVTKPKPPEPPAAAGESCRELQARLAALIEEPGEAYGPEVEETEERPELGDARRLLEALGQDPAVARCLSEILERGSGDAEP